MDEATIKVFLGNVAHTLEQLSNKVFRDKEELSEYEQRLLNDLETVIVHSQYQEMIRQHFSIKQK